jgi:cell division protein FtsQ
MATVNASVKQRVLPGFGEPLEFKRGLEKAPVKKIQSKLVVRSRHIVLFFLALAAFFFGLAKAYLYLVDCDDFAVRKTEVACRRESVGRDIRALLDASRLRNLLLLDIGLLKDRVEAHRWVREARVRKVFPSTLKIEITEREPAAVLKAGEKLFLIDRDGVWLEPLAVREEADLPLFVDSASFRDDYLQKIGLAWKCLDDLASAGREEVDTLDLSEPRSVSVYLRGQTTRLILGGERFSERLAFIRSYEENLEARNGPAEYIDLRFDDRIIFRPLPAVELAAVPNPHEEVN